MNKYIAFLRGINISGKNKISMSELKKGFEESGFREVKTYLNSGNVIFSSAGDDSSFTDKIQIMIKNKFGLDIPVFIISKEDLDEILLNAPDWWVHPEVENQRSQELHQESLNETFDLIFDAMFGYIFTTDKSTI